MKCIGTIWYVPFADLTGQCHVATDTVKQGIQRGLAGWQSIKDPADARKRLIRYDTLAPKYQALVRKHLLGGLDPHEYQQRQQQAEQGKPVAYTLTERLEQAITQDYKRLVGLWGLSDARREKSLARAGALIEAIGHHIVENRLGWKSYEAINEAIAWLGATWSDYSHWKDVPTSPIRLKERVMLRMTGTDRMQELATAPGPEPIQEVVGLKRLDNQNREKYIHSAPQPLAWAMQLATLGSDRGGNPNYSDAHIIRKVTECCQMQGIDAPSHSWFAHLFAQPHIKRIRSEYRFEKGSRHALKYSAYRPIEGAVNAGDAWLIDGTRINLIPHTAPDGSQKSLYLVFVLDVYSGDMLGWSFCYAEDRMAYVNALKMAVKHAGYVPFELVFDRFPGHNTDEFGYKERGKVLTGVCKEFDQRGVRLTCTIEATGKALIERSIRTLQDVFLQESKYYYGEGVKSTRAAAHRTTDYLTQLTKAAKLEGWDFAAAWQEAEYWLQAYRLTPVCDYSRRKGTLTDCPKDRHARSPHPLAIDVRPEETVSMFWLTKPLTISRQMIAMTVLGHEAFYPIPDADYGTLKHHDHVLVRYDETDLSSVWVFSPEGQFLALLEQGSKTKRWGQEQPRLDSERKAFVANQQAIRAQHQTDLDQMRAGGDDINFLLGARNPKALREAAEDSQLVELVTAQMQARYPDPPPKPKPKPLPPDEPVKFDPKAFARRQM